MFGKTLVVGGRDIVLGHQILGEPLAPFNLCRCLVGAENLQPSVLESIDDPHGQRHFRANHGEVDLFGDGKLAERLDLVGSDIDALGNLRNPRIPRRAVEGFNQRRLGDFPAKGVFATATTDN